MNRTISILLALLLCPLCYGAVLTVNSAGGAQYTTIQAAINAAQSGDSVQVASGTYNERIRFNGKSISVSGTDAVIDGTGLFGSLVSFDSGENSNAVLSGFEITNGRASQGGGIYCGYSSNPTISDCRILNNTSTGAGGGIYCFNSSNPTITDCNISDNTASGDGGGVSCYYNCSPHITRCSMMGNQSVAGGGTALACDTSSSPVVTDCEISLNTGGRGAIRCSWESNPIITHCRITGNQGGTGGALSLLNSSPELANCLIVGNTASQDGGAMDSYYMSHPVLTNCTIVANITAGQAGGILTDDGVVTLVNCILWGNVAGTGSTQDAQLYADSGSPDVSFCCIQDDTPGDLPVPFGADHNNVDTDPLFQRAPDDGGDGWGDGNDDYGDLQLLYGSSCLDAGSNSAATDISDIDLDSILLEPCPWDIDQNDRFIDDPSADDTGAGTTPIIDIGAYESSGHETPPTYMYQLIDLSKPNCIANTVECINNHNVVVGATRLPDPNVNIQATLFDVNEARDHHLLGGVGGQSSNAVAINDSGLIVGYAMYPEIYYTAAIFDPTGNGNNIDLGGLGGTSSGAQAVNNNGWIVGYSHLPGLGAGTHATRFDPTGGGDNIDLGTLGGEYSFANGVNDKGVIVGEAAGYSGKRATIFDPNGNHHNNINLGVPSGGGSSRANAINNAGMIVGVGEYTGRATAMMFLPDGDPRFHILGLLPSSTKPSEAFSINNRGQIVGKAVSAESKQCATLFDPTGAGRNIDLNLVTDNPLGWQLETAEYINDSGWIVGAADSYTRGFLLIPVKPVPPVPGDNDGDSHVTWTDYTTVVDNWGTDQSDLWPDCQVPGDINGDCRVDFIDLKLLSAQWLEGTD